MILVRIFETRNKNAEMNIVQKKKGNYPLLHEMLKRQS